jgi:hypothetical protein
MEGDCRRSRPLASRTTRAGAVAVSLSGSWPWQRCSNGASCQAPVVRGLPQGDGKTIRCWATAGRCNRSRAPARRPIAAVATGTLGMTNRTGVCCARWSVCRRSAARPSLPGRPTRGVATSVPTDLPPPRGSRVLCSAVRSRVEEPNDNPDRKPRSCPNMPTADTPNDAQCAQFLRIRSVRAAPCDYGSGGRGFESLPARNSDPAS